MSGIVNVGIAGLGRSGWSIHADTLDTLPDKYRIVAVSDHLEERRRDAETRFGCRSYKEFSDLIGDGEVELTVVATPSRFHAGNAVEALRVGKSVVCEKPMAIDVREADTMLEAAVSSGGFLTIFQNRRYSSDFLAVKEIIESGVLGRIVLVRIAFHGFSRRWDWQTLKKNGGGTLNNTCPHPIDQALVLLSGHLKKDELPEVHCLRDRVLALGDADDHVKLALTVPSGLTIEIEATSACAYPRDRWLVMGSQGGLTGTGSLLEWKYFEPKELPPRVLTEEPTPDRSYNRDNIPWKIESREVTEKSGDSGRLYYLDLYERIQSGGPPAVSPESVRKQIQILEECRRQAPV